MSSFSPSAILTHLSLPSLLALSSGACIIFMMISVLWQIIRLRRTTTKFGGPSSPDFFWGRSREILSSQDVGTVYSKWADEFGPVFSVPVAFGEKPLFLNDPRAISHVYTNHTSFGPTTFGKAFIRAVVGNGLLSSEGHDHTRQRKQLSPGFSNASIRRVTPVFFDSAYKLVAAWDAMLEGSSSGEATIEVQNWMNRISLDSIGHAGFSFDFGGLEGKHSPVAQAFADLANGQSAFSMAMVALSVAFPVLLKVPTKRMRLLAGLTKATTEIAVSLLEKGKREKESGGSIQEEKSLIGLLIKSESAGDKVGMTQEEVIGQINTLLVAGYETSSISLTWAMIELARNPAIQTKLREELAVFSGFDPTYEQLNGANSETLPYLEAVTLETLRMRAPFTETKRMSVRDQYIPLSKPLATADGTFVDQIFVGKGQAITIPTAGINRLREFWGDDANEFVPERWIKKEAAGTGLPAGHKHIMTFIDGPRMCLGKAFALAEFKAVLSVIVRTYEFSFPGGNETAIDGHRTVLLRPKVAGEDGPRILLNVKRVVQ